MKDEAGQRRPRTGNNGSRIKMQSARKKFDTATQRCIHICHQTTEGFAS